MPSIFSPFLLIPFFFNFKVFSSSDVKKLADCLFNKAFMSPCKIEICSFISVCALDAAGLVALVFELAASGLALLLVDLLGCDSDSLSDLDVTSFCGSDLDDTSFCGT